MRRSLYNLAYELDSKRYLIMNGCTGAIDEVQSSIGRLVDNTQVLMDEEWKRIYTALDPAHKAALKDRGYITDKSPEDEIDMFRRVADTFKGLETKSMHITIMPTYNCNFRCPYCYELNLHSKGHNWMEHVMGMEEAKHIFKVIDDLTLKGHLIEDINLYGGEPLLQDNKEIVDYIIENAQKRELKLVAVTNGYDLEAFSDYIGPHGIGELQLTLDGSRKTHNARRKHMHNKDTYTQVVKAVNMILNKGAICNLRSNIDHYNITEIPQIFELIRKNGWDKNPLFRNYFKAVHGCYCSEDSPLTDSDISKYLSGLKETEASSGGVDISAFIRPEMTGVASELIGRFNYALKTGDYALFKSSYCGAVNGMLVFDPFGDIYPCWDVVGKPAHMIGTLSESGMVLSDNYDKWQKRQPQNIDACSVCAYALYCGGGCPAHAEVKEKSIQAPYCDAFKDVFDQVIPATYKAFEN